MAGTQVLPSWLTVSTTVLTNAAGSPTYTSSTTLELPLTYYGPSLPLGTNGIWTWGGLTSPAPTSTTTSSSSTATPSITSAPLSTPSIPSSASPSTTSSPATTTPYPYNANSVLSKGAIVGIIVGGIFFALVLLTLLICYARWRNRRQQRRQHGYNTPIWTGWEYVHPRDPEQGIYDPRPRAPSPPQGSPRSSGDEIDPFLLRPINPNGAEADEKSSSAGTQNNSNGNSGTNNSKESNQTTSSAATDYGMVLNPGRIHGGDMPPLEQPDVPARPSSEFDRHIISPSELLRLSQEDDIASRPPRMYGVSNTHLPEHLTPLLPPPPIDADRATSRKSSNLSMLAVRPLNVREKSGSRDWDEKKSAHTVSLPSSDMEESKVSTARRVRVQDLGSHSAVDEHGTSTSAGPSAWRQSISSISSFGARGLRWLTGSTGSRPSSRQDRSAGSKRGLAADGERPMSTISTKSGNTVYHDAHSRLGTPLASRAGTPSSPFGSRGDAYHEAPPLPTNAPPPPYKRNAVEDQTIDGGAGDLGQRRVGGGDGEDYLDLPPPMQSSQFAASRGHLPPGLPEMPNPTVWRNSATWTAESGNGSSSAGDAGITIDILDAEPPAAREGWRSLAIASGGVPNERRTTFGTIVNPPDYLTSEQGSLHSMRSHSHLSPTYTPTSSGSAPVSSGHQVFGSNSSRPSARSRLRSPSSKGSELSHTHHSQPSWSQSGSGSSYARRQMNSSSSHGHNNHPISPSVSAFGSMLGLHHLEESEEHDPRVSWLGPMPSFGMPTIRPVGTSAPAPSTHSADSEVTGANTTISQDSASETEALHFPDVPRFRGLTVQIP